MATVKENLEKIRQRVALAAKRAGRDPELVRLVAVSKRMPVERIQEAVEAGQRLFGENYLQEAREKIERLSSAIRWHFIGHLQANKAKQAAERFDAIETVDRLKLATMLEKHLASLDKTLPILVQVNIGREPQKAGIFPEDAGPFLRDLARFGHLQVKGLMVMPPYFDDPEAVRPYFRQTRRLAEELVREGLLGRHGPPELSMGMSGDFEVAVEEGATLVRVGTALFGPRA